MLLGTSILGYPYVAVFTDGSDVSGGGLASSLILPLPVQVQTGVMFGPNNTLTGTFTGGGGGGAVFPLGG